MLNLRSYDLNLLVIFKAVMVRRSVAGAAEQVGLSPSAVSHALARLRVMLNDELFIRTSKGLEPSSRAIELFDEIETGLAHIANAIQLQQRFVPQEAERVFSMQIADYVSGLLLPPLAQRLSSEAPRASVEVIPFLVNNKPMEVQADVQIRFTPGGDVPTVARSRRLLSDKFIVVMRNDHPATQQDMTAELYADLTHVKLSQAATGTTMIDDALADRGLKRRVAMTVPSWFDMPEIIERTDMIAIVPRRWAQVDARIARLSNAPLPLEEIGFSIDLFWDVHRDRDPGQKWFREIITEIFSQEHGAFEVA